MSILYLTTLDDIDVAVGIVADHLVQSSGKPSGPSDSQISSGKYDLAKIIWQIIFGKNHLAKYLTPKYHEENTIWPNHLANHLVQSSCSQISGNRKLVGAPSVQWLSGFPEIQKVN